MIECYAIQNEKGLWYRTNGYEKAQTGYFYNRNWVDNLDKAVIYSNLPYVKGLLTKLKSTNQNAKIVKLKIEIEE